MMLKVILQVAAVALTAGARSEVKAGTDSIFIVREPFASCSAISCEVTTTIGSEFEVNEQWVIFKNHTVMRITEWNTDEHKYAASNNKAPSGCTSWCNYTVTLVINRPDQQRDYGLYQLILRSYDAQKRLQSKLVLNITVPTMKQEISVTVKPPLNPEDTLISGPGLSFWTIMVIAISGTSITIIICFTVCLLVFCRGRKAQKKKKGNRKPRESKVSLGVSTHLYDEVESVAHNAYCELNEDMQKTSHHQYIKPIPEEAPVYKAPEIFSNTESPSTVRDKTTESTSNDSMGYLQPSVKFRPEMAVLNQLYDETNKSTKKKKPLEPTYSNSQKMAPRQTVQNKFGNLSFKTTSELDKATNVIYAQPHPPPKSNHQISSSNNELPNVTQKEPTYDNEERTPPIPIKVLKSTFLERNQSIKDVTVKKAAIPDVPPKPVGRIVLNQLYDEGGDLNTKKKQVIPSYSNPIATKLPTKKYSRSKSEDSELSRVHSCR